MSRTWAEAAHSGWRRRIWGRKKRHTRHLYQVCSVFWTWTAVFDEFCKAQSIASTVFLPCCARQRALGAVTFAAAQGQRLRHEDVQRQARSSESTEGFHRRVRINSVAMRTRSAEVLDVTDETCQKVPSVEREDYHLSWSDATRIGLSIIVGSLSWLIEDLSAFIVCFSLSSDVTITDPMYYRACGHVMSTMDVFANTTTDSGKTRKCYTSSSDVTRSRTNRSARE